MRVFVISLVSYICVGCRIPNKFRSLLGSVLSLIDALQGAPIFAKPIGVFLLCYTNVLLSHYSSGWSADSPFH